MALTRSFVRFGALGASRNWKDRAICLLEVYGHSWTSASVSCLALVVSEATQETTLRQCLRLSIRPSSLARTRSAERITSAYSSVPDTP